MEYEHTVQTPARRSMIRTVTPRHPHPVLGPCQNAVACHLQLEEAKHAAAGDTSNSGSLFDEHSGQY